jgi:hypothetical protein
MHIQLTYVLLPKKFIAIKQMDINKTLEKLRYKMRV